MTVEPVLAPGVTDAAMTDGVCDIALGRRLGWWLPCLTLALAGLGLLGAAVGWLFYAGLGIWGIDWPVVWGLAIINYVWWIGIASGGTFISAFFFLMQVEWRTALNRIAETMTLFAAACAGLFPILHLGRPWLCYWLFPYPNTMDLWPQFRSPLLWDFFAILAYVVSSILFWFLGLIPDLASLRDRAAGGRVGRGRAMLYGAIAMGFRGTSGQWRRYRATYGVMAAIMAPLVVSVHSIVGLDFAGAQTPGWHSTQFPPFFVFGAVLSGFATVLCLALPLRRLLGLEAFITMRHLDVLTKLLLVSSLCVAYAYVMDAFSVYYGADEAELAMFRDRAFGHYAPVYWATILFNVLLPQLFWLQRLRLHQPLVLITSFLVIIGMWLERYEIVVTSLHRPHLPSAWGFFRPTFWDWATLAGTVGLFACGMLLFVRFLPVLSMFELRELIGRRRP